VIQGSGLGLVFITLAANSLDLAAYGGHGVVQVFQVVLDLANVLVNHGH
jgi:hypothetical protein